MRRDLTQRQRLLEYLKSYAPARARDLEDIGVTAAAISRSVQSGEVLRLGRGLYGLPDSAPNTHETLIEVAKRAPKAVICLTSALAFHGLTDQLPRRVWIAIGAKGWEPKITLEEMVHEMMENDINIAKRDSLVKEYGFKAREFNE